MSTPTTPTLNPQAILTDIDPERVQRAVLGIVAGHYKAQITRKTEHELRGQVSNGTGSYGVSIIGQLQSPTECSAHLSTQASMEPQPPFQGANIGVGWYCSRKNFIKASSSSCVERTNTPACQAPRTSESASCSATRRKMPRAFRYDINGSGV